MSYFERSDWTCLRSSWKNPESAANFQELKILFYFFLFCQNAQIFLAGDVDNDIKKIEWNLHRVSHGYTLSSKVNKSSRRLKMTFFEAPPNGGRRRDRRMKGFGRQEHLRSVTENVLRNKKPG